MEELKIIGLLLYTIITWFVMVYPGYGAQSLTNIIEIPILILVSMVLYFLMRDWKYYGVLKAIFFSVLLVRTVMPAIAE